MDARAIHPPSIVMVPSKHDKRSRGPGHHLGFVHHAEQWSFNHPLLKRSYIHLPADRGMKSPGRRPVDKANFHPIIEPRNTQSPFPPENQARSLPRAAVLRPRTTRHHPPFRQMPQRPPFPIGTPRSPSCPIRPRRAILRSGHPPPPVHRTTVPAPSPVA